MKRSSLVCLFALSPLVASANIIPSVSSVTGTGPYVWSYNLQLSRDQDVHSGLAPTSALVPHENLTFGSFLTIFDFAGYVAGSCTGPTGWVCTSQNLGFTPDDVLPTDNPNVANVTWVYTTGPTLTGMPNGFDLGTFGASSIYNNTTLISYAARGVKNSGASAGTIADNVGSVAGPTGNRVPEPGSLALAGLALVALGSLHARRAEGNTARSERNLPGPLTL